MNAEVLALHLEAYIGVREALGFQMQAQRILLQSLVQFIVTEGDGGPLRAQWALQWACATSNQYGRRGAAYRLSVARGFLRYMRAAFPDTEVPDYPLVAWPRRPQPYLFTAEQIATLTEAALTLGPSGAIRALTLATVIGVLASTGLRAGEVMRLTVEDVYLDHGPPYLRIRETKFHKSRLVSLHPATVMALRAYLQQRYRLGYAGLTEVVFVSEQGQALNHSTLSRWFTRLCRAVNFWPTDTRRAPSLGSLRHSFAVQRLQTWYEAGHDIATLLPTLSVYLGHVRPQDTFWYLTATPELLTAAAERFEAYNAKGGAL